MRSVQRISLIWIKIFTEGRDRDEGKRSQWAASASISARMATDSATLTPPARAARRTASLPKIQSPAEPLARGMGLDQPFFEDKNRAFWILQSIGWTGYFVLRSLSGFANS